MEDNSGPETSSSQRGLVERFRSHFNHGSQGELSIAAEEDPTDAQASPSPALQLRPEAPAPSAQRRPPAPHRRVDKAPLPDSSRNALASLDGSEAIKKLEQVQELPEEEVRVDLEDPGALATFLVTANIKLVRAEYLAHLVTEDRRLPRRQEAEGESFVDRTGKTCSALVDHEEIQAWASGSKEAIIASVSHAWEAREHPDPCGHQLEQVVSHAALFVAAFAADVWFFFDYVSLFQFKRQKEVEERSFRRSMGNMHALYAHESTMTFRIENLTPEHRLQKAIQDGSQVTIFHDNSGGVKPVPLAELMRNTKAYLERGWCRAEMSWSSGRGDTAQHQRIDVEVTEEKKKGINAHLTGRTPVAPDAFAADMHSAAFTHRSDESAVIELQKKVFLEKVTRRRKLKVEGVSLEQMRALTLSLRHFKELKNITLNDFRADANEANAFVEALATTTQVKKASCRSKDAGSLYCLVKAILAALASKTLKLTHLDLASEHGSDWAQLGYRGAEVLAEALKENSTLKRLNLAGNDIGILVVQGVRVLPKSSTLLSLDLSVNQLDRTEAEVLAEALKENSTLKRLNLAGNDIGILGVQALQQALETNTTLEHLELGENPGFYPDPEADEALEAACRANPRICKPSPARSEATDGSDEECQKSPFKTAVRIKGLADQLRLNQIVTEVNLSGQDICDEQAKALADALQVNKTVTKVNLGYNNFGNEGVKALADAFRVNMTVTKVVLKMNNFGDDSLKALSDAFRVNKAIATVWLGGNNFGDEGLKALASAMEVNETITEVGLDMSLQLSDEGRQAMEDIHRFCQRNKVQGMTKADLSSRYLGDEQVKALADALRVNHTVTTVDLRYNKFGDEGLKALASAMEVNETITVVDLDMKKGQFTDEGRQAMEDIHRFCQRNKELQSTDLSRRYLGDEQVKAFADDLRINKTVKTVDLSYNKFGDDGLKAFADVLRVNKAVTTVDLSANKFGDDGLKALADALRVNHTMTTVHLRYNNFGAEGLKALASAMEVNETITEVGLRFYKELSDEGRQAVNHISRFCERNKA